MVKFKDRFLRKINILFHEFTSSKRVLPDFLIVGNSFCGKTLLYNYLCQHKAVLKNLREETGYFFDTHDKGIKWYKSNFPTVSQVKSVEQKQNIKPRVGETVNIPFKILPKRIFDTIGSPKIIVLLRNPVERSYARYLSLVRRGFEKKSFEEVIELEDYSFKTDNREKFENKIYYNSSKKLSPYITRSIYVDDLKNWGKFFSIEKMLFIKSEDLFENPFVTVNKVLNFLNLDSIKQLSVIGKDLDVDSPKLTDKTKKKLEKLFRQYNKELSDYVGFNLEWD